MFNVMLKKSSWPLTFSTALGVGEVFSTYSERHSRRSKAVVPNTPEGQCTQKMCLGTELVEKAMN